jgi:hypothetical protein
MKHKHRKLRKLAKTQFCEIRTVYLNCMHCNDNSDDLYTKTPAILEYVLSQSTEIDNLLEDNKVPRDELSFNIKEMHFSLLYNVIINNSHKHLLPKEYQLDPSDLLKGYKMLTEQPAFATFHRRLAIRQKVEKRLKTLQEMCAKDCETEEMQLETAKIQPKQDMQLETVKTQPKIEDIQSNGTTLRPRTNTSLAESLHSSENHL